MSNGWTGLQQGCIPAIYDNERVYPTGWQARFPLVAGIKRTVPWIEAQAGGGRAGWEGVAGGWFLM